MKLSRWVLAFITVSFLLGADGEAGTIARDFSGDAMQRHDSRMMASPLQRQRPDQLAGGGLPFPHTVTRCAGPSEILDQPMRDLCGDPSESGDEPNGTGAARLFRLTL